MAVIFVSARFASADSGVAQHTHADQAFAKYGLTGKHVIVAILDRGIDYTHHDFRNANGTTRIRMMWDMSNANPNLPICDPAQPAPIQYTQAQINSALTGGPPVAERDAVGHGTVSTGLAAGNGRAALPTSVQWAGLAPAADLLIVKMTSEGAPAHSGHPAEEPFQGCMGRALQLVATEAASLGEPIVALMDSGTQWGPIDGTSAVSETIDSEFGSTKAGYVYVAASGDEGNLANHANTTFTSASPAVFDISIAANNGVAFQLWYTGALPATVSFTTNITLTAPTNSCASSPDGTVRVCQYNPHQQFYPWTSSGPDRAVWFFVRGHSGTATVRVQTAANGTGVANIYGDARSPTPVISFGNHLKAGRLSDYSSTHSAIAAGCYNVRTGWTDVNGNPESLTTEGATNALWSFSSGGPTRDGRSPIAPTYGGIDVVTPGGNSFAAYSPTSYWGDTSLFAFNQIEGGNHFYGRHSATSASAPILVGAVAQMLQMNPRLAALAIRQYLHQSAISDTFTGATPNLNWGRGKLNILGALNLVAAAFHTNPSLSANSLTFPPQAVGTTSTARSVTFTNTGTGATDALGISSIGTSGDFHIESNTCGSSLAAGSSCVIHVAFRPTQTDARAGTLTIKDFNTHSPHTVALSGTGL
jgi:hypothetical protein